MKTFPAILFALFITAAIAVTMFVIGGNALANTDVVPVANAPASASAASISPQAQNSTSSDSKVQQLQQLVAQYQQREKQYQAELKQAAQRINDANQQLNQANQQVQMYTQVMQALQSRGIIRITNDGQIYLRGGD